MTLPLQQYSAAHTTNTAMDNIKWGSDYLYKTFRVNVDGKNLTEIVTRVSNRHSPAFLGIDIAPTHFHHEILPGEKALSGAD